MNVAYNTGVRRFPTFGFELFAHGIEHLLIVRVGHLLVYPKIVAGHVIRRDLEIL